MFALLNGVGHVSVRDEITKYYLHYLGSRDVSEYTASIAAYFRAVIALRARDGELSVLVNFNK